MDIVLATNSTDPALALRAIEAFNDGSGIGCILEVRSGWLAASYRLSVEPHPLEVYLAALRKLNDTLTGEAVLKPEWEPQHLRMSGDGLGHILVSGELIEHGPHRQVVRFAFETDQTCLPPLITAFEALVRLLTSPAAT